MFVSVVDFVVSGDTQLIGQGCYGTHITAALKEREEQRSRDTKGM